MNRRKLLREGLPEPDRTTAVECCRFCTHPVFRQREIVIPGIKTAGGLKVTPDKSKTVGVCRKHYDTTGSKLVRLAIRARL